MAWVLLYTLGISVIFYSLGVSAGRKTGYFKGRAVGMRIAQDRRVSQ
jgi:hypothetical protein